MSVLQSEKLSAAAGSYLVLHEIQDLDILLERILSDARKALNADAGTLYINESGQLALKYAQNETLSKKLSPGEKLSYSLFKLAIDETSVAGYVASRQRTLNIPNMYAIPESEPYRFNTFFDRESGYFTVSTLTVPLVSNRGILLGVLQLINAKTQEERIVSFDQEDQEVIRLFAGTATMAIERAALTRGIIMRMVDMAGLRDPKETGAHVNRVAAISAEIYEAWAKRKQLSASTIEKDKDMLRMVAMLHDVGKVGVSDLILKKEGPLTHEERDLIETHTIVGSRLFAGNETLIDRFASEVALHHHENWNGEGGYPGAVDPRSGKPLKRDGNGRPAPLKGYEIPLFARIVSLADVYDALLSRRVYKPAWTEEEAIKEMHTLSGKKFDPELIDVFLSILPTISQLMTRFPDVG